MTAQKEITILIDGKYFKDGISQVCKVVIDCAEHSLGCISRLSTQIDTENIIDVDNLSYFIMSECAPKMFAFTCLSIAREKDWDIEKKTEIALRRIDAAFNYPTMQGITLDLVRRAIESFTDILNTSEDKDEILSQAMEYFFI